MNILYLTFYFEPDLCAGSFRNAPLVAELARQLAPGDQIHVVTTQPNRYASYQPDAPAHEQRGPVRVDRVAVPAHAGGLTDQVRSFGTYYRAVHQLTKAHRYDLVVASSSRLFTAFLGARLARRLRVPLFLDIRDLFRETILDVLTNPVARLGLNPLLWVVERYTFGYARHINLVSEGFLPYFAPFRRATYSYFTNGIDDEFLRMAPAERPADNVPNNPQTLLYAGNIGEGQGLHNVIPAAARRLGDTYRFVIIGDGGARQKLEDAIRRQGVTNVELRPPVSRSALVAAYQRTDYLFVHLADLDAFRRVLPSKLFEYGATDKPIVAGVAGYAARFVTEHLANCILFAPGDAADLVAQLRRTPYRTEARPDFVGRFGRQTIMRQMARLIRQTAGADTHSPVGQTSPQPAPMP